MHVTIAFPWLSTFISSTKYLVHLFLIACFSFNVFLFSSFHSISCNVPSVPLFSLSIYSTAFCYLYICHSNFFPVFTHLPFPYKNWKLVWGMVCGWSIISWSLGSLSISISVLWTFKILSPCMWHVKTLCSAKHTITLIYSKCITQHQISISHTQLWEILLLNWAKGLPHTWPQWDRVFHQKRKSVFLASTMPVVLEFS